MTYRGFGYEFAVLLAIRFTTQVCGPPQGAGPLPATGEARCSVVLL